MRDILGLYLYGCGFIFFVGHRTQKRTRKVHHNRKKVGVRVADGKDLKFPIIYIQVNILN